MLAEIPLDTLSAPHVDDPARYTAAMVDIAVDRIRTGDADRDIQKRAEQRRFAQMRDQAADLVREAWATRPQLADTVIHAPAFDALVRALDRYTTPGSTPVTRSPRSRSPNSTPPTSATRTATPSTSPTAPPNANSAPSTTPAAPPPTAPNASNNSRPPPGSSAKPGPTTPRSPTT